jgi:hypothetical protein
MNLYSTFRQVGNGIKIGEVIDFAGNLNVEKEIKSG